MQELFPDATMGMYSHRTCCSLLTGSGGYTGGVGGVGGAGTVTQRVCISREPRAHSRRRRVARIRRVGFFIRYYKYGQREADIKMGAGKGRGWGNKLVRR